MIKKFSILYLFLLTSCSTMQQTTFDHSLKSGQCEEAAKSIPSSTPTVFDRTKQFSGSVASYALTGLTYGTEVTVYITGGIAGGIVICSPLILAESAASGGGHISGDCVARAGGMILGKISGDTMLGKKVFENTNKWRCPDLSQFSQDLRAIASCYESRGDTLNKEKAREQLDLIRSPEFQKCVDEEEMKKISDQYQNLQKVPGA